MARRDGILVGRTFYQIGVMTLIASIMWVGVSVYSASTKQLLGDIDKTLLEPLNPVIDQEIIDSLTTRLKIEASIVEESIIEESIIEENDELTN